MPKSSVKYHHFFLSFALLQLICVVAAPESNIINFFCLFLAPPQTPPSATDPFGFPAVPNSVSNVTPGSPAPSTIPSYPSMPVAPSSPGPDFNPPPQQQPRPDYSSHNQTGMFKEKVIFFFSIQDLIEEKKIDKMKFLFVGNVVLNAEQMSKAQKYIKWAGSACNYDDVPTAIDNLHKALRLLTTGQDS